MCLFLLSMKWCHLVVEDRAAVEQALAAVRVFATQGVQGNPENACKPLARLLRIYL